jgi:hypothetical protein
MNRLEKLIREALSTPPSKDKCNCGCHDCDNVGNPGVVINESLSTPITMTENLRYHVENKLPLTENTFRYGSKSFLDLWAEARYLYLREAIHVNDLDKEILAETNLGEYGMFEGKRVPLDMPMEYKNPYEPILEDILVYGKIYESVNIDNSYKLDDIKSNDVGNEFMFTDKHGIKRKLMHLRGNSVKLLWLNPSTQEWTTDDIPSKYEDEKVMNTFGMLLVKVILPKYGSFNLQALSMARYRLFRALIYNNLDTSKYEMDYDDDARTIDVHRIEGINEADKKDPPIGKPKRGGSGGKKYYVYVRDPKTKRIKKVSFGDAGGLKAKINNPEARRAFAKRHKCGTGEPKTSAKYWSCRLPRYAKALGINTTFTGFW